MWTNGKFKAVYRFIRDENGRVIETIEPNDIPSKDGSIDEVDRPTRAKTGVEQAIETDDQQPATLGVKLSGYTKSALFRLLI